MQFHHRKRRLPVHHRGQRVPGLYKRPKPPTDRREGDTYEVIFRDETSKQRQKTLKARTIQRAVVEAEDYRTQVRRGEIVVSSRLTMAEVAEEYFSLMDSLVATGERSKRTVDLYRQRFKTHIEPTLGRKRVQDVRAEHIAAIYTKQRGNGIAAWTISGTHTILSGLFRFGLTRGYIATNPLDRLSKIEKPKQRSEREARRLSDDEIRKLCEAATPTYRPIITTLAWTGMRVSEALGLRWEDVDFEAKEVRVRGQLTDEGTIKRPKTRAGTRSVPMLPVVEQELREHRKTQLTRGLLGSDRLVFTTQSGRPLNRHNVRNKGIGTAANKAGLHPEGATKITTHDLRRTFISHLILGLGLDPVRVSKIAGHSNVSVTLNVYADEFDKAMHKDDLHARIAASGFGAV
jgi:integrase